ncbi:MAG TPA: hypothetical protein VGC44_11035 [Longimicrobiales bacterium]
MKRTIVGILLLVGCSSTLDIDDDDLTRLPNLEQLNYSGITPAQSHRYWELRESWGAGGADRVLGSGGQVPRSQLDSASITALNNTRPTSGFAIGCLPAYCYKYVVAVNGTVHAYTSAEALRQFLGTIDSVEEAALVALARNLYWSGDDPATGFAAVSVGWEIVGLELVRSCAPVQTDRVHILVRRDGTIRELGREVHSKLENACV